MDYSLLNYPQPQLLILRTDFPDFRFCFSCYAVWERKQLSSFDAVCELGKKRSLLSFPADQRRGVHREMKFIFNDFVPHSQDRKRDQRKRWEFIYFKSLDLSTK